MIRKEEIKHEEGEWDDHDLLYTFNFRLYCHYDLKIPNTRQIRPVDKKLQWIKAEGMG